MLSLNHPGSLTNGPLCLAVDPCLTDRKLVSRYLTAFSGLSVLITDGQKRLTSLSQMLCLGRRAMLNVEPYTARPSLKKVFPFQRANSSQSGGQKIFFCVQIISLHIRIILKYWSKRKFDRWKLLNQKSDLWYKCVAFIDSTFRHKKGLHQEYKIQFIAL